MPSPFPGMDPYLEDSRIRPGFHHRPADEIAAIQTVYERAGYDLRIDYRQAPPPALRPEAAAWLEARLAQPE